MGTPNQQQLKKKKVGKKKSHKEQKPDQVDESNPITEASITKDKHKHKHKKQSKKPPPADDSRPPRNGESHSETDNAASQPSSTFVFGQQLQVSDNQLASMFGGQSGDLEPAVEAESADGGDKSENDVISSTIPAEGESDMSEGEDHDDDDEDGQGDDSNENSDDDDLGVDEDAPFGFLGIRPPQAETDTAVADSADDGQAVDADAISEQEKARLRAERNARTVFVGNLPPSCKQKHLRKLFQDCGEIESIRFRTLSLTAKTMDKKASVLLRKKIATDLSSINAYVVFKSVDSINRALEKNATTFLDRHIRVDSCEETRKKPVFEHHRSVFVGNIPFDVTEEEVRSFFEEAGEITGVRVVRDKALAVGKGFAYVEFAIADSVGLALSMNDKLFRKRKVRVKRCLSQKKQERTKRTQGRVPGEKDTPLTGAALRVARKAKDAPTEEAKAGPNKQGRPVKRKAEVVLDHRGKKPRHKPRPGVPSDPSKPYMGVHAKQGVVPAGAAKVATAAAKKKKARIAPAKAGVLRKKQKAESQQIRKFSKALKRQSKPRDPTAASTARK